MALRHLVLGAGVMIGLSTTAGAAVLQSSRISLIGVATIPFGQTYAGTPVGGLSGIDYNPGTGAFAVISDDRGQNAPARFYTLQIPVTADGVGAVTFTGVTTLKDAGGSSYPALAVDPESIRFAPGGYVWSTEGNFASGAGTSIYRVDADGRATRQINPPAAFTIGANHGIRNNLGFEGLSYTPDGSALFAAAEAALQQDGPIATPGTGSTSRIVRFDPATGAPVAEYVYPIDPIPRAPIGPGSADNGVSEILALDNDHLLIMERSFATGAGNSIRLFLADLTRATNVLGEDSLAGLPYQPADKTLLADLAVLGITPDNVEGLTFGPALPNGDATLLLVSDNNFSSAQVQQVIALRVTEVPEPMTASLLLFGLMGLAVLGHRCPS